MSTTILPQNGSKIYLCCRSTLEVENLAKAWYNIQAEAGKSEAYYAFERWEIKACQICQKWL
jgi:hypothetical protein